MNATPRTRSELQAVILPAILAGKKHLSELKDDELALLAGFIERCNAKQVSIKASAGRLVDLTAHLNTKSARGSLKGFTRLKSLFFYWGDVGAVRTFDDGFFDAPALEEAQFQNGAVSAVPAGLLRHPRLRRLVIHGPAKFPEVKLACPNLRELAVGVSEFPAALLSLTKLEDLSLAGGKLTRLPANLGRMKGLKRLRLSENRLTSLPDSLGALTRLEELILSDNELAALPASLGKLKNLRELQVDDNALATLPDGLAKLRRLKLLVVSGNAWKALPACVERLGLPRRSRTDAIIRQHGLVTGEDEG